MVEETFVGAAAKARGERRKSLADLAANRLTHPACGGLVNRGGKVCPSVEPVLHIVGKMATVA